MQAKQERTERSQLWDRQQQGKLSKNVDIHLTPSVLPGALHKASQFQS